MTVIDCHCHAFPDAIAARAVPAIADLAGISVTLGGTIRDLLASMDEAGIATSVIASIATKPGHFASILEWSLDIASDRIVPLASIHPRDPDAVAHVHTVQEHGLKGVKLHPYYQEFDLDDPGIFPLYAALESAGLVLLIHAGFDIAYPRVRRCDPVRIRTVLERFPGLRLIASHLGGWFDWDAVERELIGRPVYLDTSYAIEDLGPERARKLILAHRPEHVLFGSDSPWKRQKDELGRVRGLELGSELEGRVLGANAGELLGGPATC